MASVALHTTKGFIIYTTILTFFFSNLVPFVNLPFEVSFNSPELNFFNVETLRGLAHNYDIPPAKDMLGQEGQTKQRRQYLLKLNHYN